MTIFTRLYRRWLANRAKRPVRETTDEQQSIENRATAPHREQELQESSAQAIVANNQHSNRAGTLKQTPSPNSALRADDDSQRGDTSRPTQQKSNNKNSPKTVSHDPLPDPKDIEEGGSFARFLADDVDMKNQTSALQMLWKQPHYQVLDGLEQCDQDFSNQPKLLDSEKQQLIKQVYRHLVKDDEYSEEDDSTRCTADVADGEESDATTDANSSENAVHSNAEHHPDKSKI